MRAPNLWAVARKHVLQLLLIGHEGDSWEALMIVERGVVLVTCHCRCSRLLRRCRLLGMKVSHRVATFLVLNLIDYELVVQLLLF